MTPARFQTIEEIYRAALEQQPEQLSAFLDRACKGDAILRHKVEALLSSRQRADSFIEDSAVGLVARIIQNGDAESLVGETIGHYRISESIGIGGMGEVYLATDIVAGRKAALKLLPTRFTRDAERLKRFRQEARAVVRLNHPNILTVYEIGEDHSIQYIASELIEGETLRDRLTRGPMQLNEAVDIAIQVASALAAAHQAGIVHRDIKPENIMLRPDGYVKVLDFGIAKLAESAFAETTADAAGSMTLAETNLGSILGTVRYMSPEQACPDGVGINKSTDIWSLGVVLYEMVTGHVPFTGNTPKDVVSSILKKEPPPLTRYVAHAPAELQQIVSTTLRKDREERYHGGRELLEALKDLRRKLDFESFVKSGFFDEVKRRKVYRVAAAYIIAAAGIIQLASAAFPAWELPNWALRLVIVLLLVGFPLALILGWAFDITAQGIRATPSAALGTHRRRNVIMLVAAGVIISAAAGFFLLPRVSAHKVDKSIAVLPFENLSGDPDNTYFADGVQDEILTNLARIADLKVISRMSVMHYKSGIARNLREIGQQLGVANVLEGSVQRSGNRVRVNAQLIDARSERPLWGQTYDRDLADVFAIQSEIAKAIADQLRAKLSPREKNAIELPPTTDIPAFDLYARARNLYLTAYMKGGAGNEDLLQAVDLLNQAVARDPSFFQAYCQLAFTHDSIYGLGWDHTPARLAQAEAAVQAAARLRPEAGETHLARARNLYLGYLDYDAALAELEIAGRMMPGDSWVPLLKGAIERRRGYWDDSIRDMERAIELDPQNVLTLQQTALSYKCLRRYAEEKSTLARVLAFEPDDAVARVWQAFVELDSQADTYPLHQTIDSIKGANPAAISRFAQAWIFCGLAERDGAAAKNALDAFGENPINFGLADNMIFNRPFAEGIIARMTKDDAKAQTAFTVAHAEQEKIIQAQPNYGPALCVLGLIDAGLGRKEQALREGRRAVELLPVGKDALEGANMLKYLALIAAWVGDKDLACEQLAHASRLPSSVSYGELKLIPWWDPLRGDPRFEQIVASLAPNGNQPVARGPASGENPTTSARPEKSIAVLPFENASNDPNAEYLSEGISEALINSLAELQQLRVIARSTAFHYKGRDVDPRQVGRELQVAAVLTGRVRQMQDALNVQVDLVDATTGAQLWGAGYERKISDVIAVKQAIAREVTEKLKLKLSGEEQRQLVKLDSTNAEAYQFYLRGRYFWNKRTPDGIRRAFEQFQQAIEHDPNFALGYVGLADSYTALAFYNFAAPHDAMPKAKESALKALALDNTVAEAHASLAHISMNYYWDWPTAEKEFKRSIELKPDYATAHQWYAIHYLTATGRLDEALREMKKALELEPASLVMNTFLGATLYYAGRYDEAIDQCRRTLEMDPNFAVAHWHLGLAYEQKQVFDAAIEEFQRAISLSGGSPLMRAALGHAYAMSQNTYEANKILDELNELSKQQYVSPYEVAAIYVALGNNEKAFQLLEKAYTEHSFHFVNLNVSPHFKSLRSDPRFQDLVRRIGLPK